MKKIEQLSDHIKEEIEDAQTYAREALELKNDDKAIADLYATLANEELKHMQMLHDLVVKIIEAYRKEHGDPPAEMLMRYNILHEIHTKDANNVRLMIKLYKGE